MERPAAQTGIWVAAACVVALVAFRLLDGTGGRDPAPVEVGGHGTRADAARHRRSGIVVHVAGAVRRPGVYRVPARARVAVALRSAGGASRVADLTAVNLAAHVQDGQQVVVPRRGAAAPPGGGASAGPKLGLGSATAEQLAELDGIGPTLAERIVEYRQARGGFRSLEQLRDVEGIGEKRFEALRERLQP